MKRFVLALGFILSIAVTSRAEVTDPAQLFPAGTLAYAELHRPADLGPELAAVVKGSVLEDSLRLVHDRRDKTKNIQVLTGEDELGILGLLASPEMIGEFRKVRGMALGITGFNERHGPDIAFAVLTGESHSLGLAVRAYLTVRPNVRRIGVASGVPVFQIRPPSIEYTQTGPVTKNEKPVEGFGQMTFAYTPGLFVVGNSRAAVSDVITRFKGEGKSPLADVPGFKAAAANRSPGIFWYAVPAELSRKFDAANKEHGEHVDADGYAFLKFVANVQSIRTASGRVSFRDKGLSLAAKFELEPGSTSPLLTLLSGQATEAITFQQLPGSSAFGVFVTLPESGRAEAVLGFLDSLAKAAGTLGRQPSQAEKEISAKFKVAIADALLAHTQAVAIVLPVKQDLPQGSLPLPLLVLHTEEDVAAGKWADGIRALAAGLAGADALPEPSTEMVEGVKVFSLPAANLPWKNPIHYAAEGTLFALGFDRGQVASAVKARQAAPAQANLLDTKGATAVGTLNLGNLVRIMRGEMLRNEGGVSLKPADASTIPRINRGYRIPPQGNPPNPEVKKQEAKTLEEWLASLAAMPVAQAVVRRMPTEVRLDCFFPDMQGGAAAKVIDMGVAWFQRSAAVAGNEAVELNVLP